MKIKPLQIGSITFPNNLIQGPLAGYSNAPFRELVTRFSKPAFTYTEMLSCKTLNYLSLARIQRFVAIHAKEGPVCFQLSSNDPDELAAAVATVTTMGANLIDLNCGCPVKKIRGKQAGSRLLSDPDRLSKLANAMRSATSLPISIKIRVDGRSDERFNAEVLQVIQESQLDFVTVHGRHWTEKYDVACDREQIKYFVDQLSIPVIGNGDVDSYASLMQMLETGCAGAMIARAIVGQPWLIGQWLAEFNNEAFTTPDNQQIGEIFCAHVNALIALFGNEFQAICAARKMAKYYARQIPNSSEFCTGVQTCESFLEFKKLCEYYF